MNEQLLCKNLTMRYGGFEALSDLNLSLDSGRIVGLLGPNGSGKTTFIKLINGLLSPKSGEIRIKGIPVGIETKKMVSYLPDKNYLNTSYRVSDILDYFSNFYKDFSRTKALNMLESLQIVPGQRLKTMSKGTLEKVQLILVMSRQADLYILDEPIAGVDPAARDYILRTIIQNYSENATVIISTHLIADVENVLDDVIFIQKGKLVLQDSVENIRSIHGKSVDALFREVFKC